MNAVREQDSFDPSTDVLLAETLTGSGSPGRRGRLTVAAGAGSDRAVVLPGLLTVLTAGLALPWFVAALRRRLFSGVRFLGSPVEDGTKGAALLLAAAGCVVAVAGAALIAGVLGWFGARALPDAMAPDGTAAMRVAQGAAATIAVLGLFWSSYRLRRHRLRALTWRGARFDLAPGAAGYAVLALTLWVVTVLTLGILYPLCQFVLARYRTERTRLGGLSCRQDGRWTALLGFWAWVYLPVLPVALVLAGDTTPPPDGATRAFVAVRSTGEVLIPAAGLAVALFAVLRYHLHAWRYLWHHRSIGPYRARCAFQPGRAILILATAGGGALFGALAAWFGIGLLICGGLALSDGAPENGLFYWVLACLLGFAASPLGPVPVVVPALAGILTGGWIFLRLGTLPLFREKASSLGLERAGNLSARPVSPAGGSGNPGGPGRTEAA